MSSLTQTAVLLITAVSILTGGAHTADFTNDEATNLRSLLELQELKFARLEEKMNKIVMALHNGRVDPLPRSCSEALTSNPSMESGIYDIDPDGSNVGDDPISVYCDVTTGTTSIAHDSEEKTATENCIGPHCYEKNIEYTASVKQMRALIDISKECRQFIEVECMEAPFEYEQSPYSFWIDVNGMERYFWAGKMSELHTCQCGIDGSCEIEENVVGLPDIRCMCDYNSVFSQNDSGYITDKVSLPVTKLYFGKYQRKSYIAHRLGRLECSGKEEVTKGKMPTNCEELALIGHSLNGFYPVKGTGKREIEMVYCDFNLTPSTGGFESRLGFLEVYQEENNNPTNCNDLKRNGHSVNGLYLVKGTGKNKIETIYCNFDSAINNAADFEKRIGYVQVFTAEKGISFYATRSSKYTIERTRIPFDQIISNNGGAMKSTGMFTAPKAGRYYFSVSGTKEGLDLGDGHVKVSLRKNGGMIGFGAGATHERDRFSNLANDFDYTFSLQSTLNLKEGDTIDVYLHTGRVKGDAFLHFNGFLIDEDLNL